MREPDDGAYVVPDEVRKASRVWKLGQVRDMMGDYLAYRAAVIDHWGVGGEDMLCDIIQLDDDVRMLDPLVRAAAVLHMHGFTYEQMEMVLATEHSAEALVYEAAWYVQSMEYEKRLRMSA